MKTVGKHYLPVALLMAAILAVCAIVTALTGATATPTTEDTKRVVTTSYPLYIAACAVTQDVEGVTVESLRGSAAGCMHDYQLTPADRVLLDGADLILMGSAAAEPFMVDILPQLDCPVVDTVHNERLQGDEEYDHDDDHHHDHAAEEHTWMQPTVYAEQCAAAADWLARVDPVNGEEYRRRAQDYTLKIRAAQSALTEAAGTLSTSVCIAFHDSVAAFAEGLGLTVAASLTVGEDSGVSAGDLAAVQRVLAAHPDALLLYDDQYDIRYTAIDTLVPPQQVLALDTVVAGDRVGDDWLDAMAKNAALLRQED